MALQRLHGDKGMRVLLAIVALAACAAGAGGSALAGDIVPVFATAAQGRGVLTSRDDFVQRMSPFDRSARLKTDKTVTEEAYLKFVATQVLDWTDSDKALLQPLLSELLPRLNALDLPWPDRIYFVETTGREEGNAAYTRANAIVLPQAVLAGGRTNADGLEAVVAHEFFHVLSRFNPALKDKLYATIGFQPCGEVAFPSRLVARKITNPDAPKNDHCIRVGIDSEDAWVVPILFSRAETYDVSRGGEFFNYLQLRFLRVDGAGPQAPRPATYNDATFQLVDLDHLSGFFEQVGRNTDYIIHPEEILADNFSLLMRGKTGVPSPDVLNNMRSALDQAKAAAPARN
jgi:hypothetical protein